MKDRLESEIKKAILDYLNMQHMTFAFKIFTSGIPDAKRQGGFRTNPSRGVADILGCKNGRFFAMEVKRPGGMVTDNQVSFLRSVNISGGYECIVRSVEDAKEAWSEI